MSEKKVVNDEEEVIKKALRKKYLKEIADQLTETASLPIINYEPKDDEEIQRAIQYSVSRFSSQVLVGLVRYLASKLADKEVELRLKEPLKKTDKDS
jgi:uncharacterized membrane protein